MMEPVLLLVRLAEAISFLSMVRPAFSWKSLTSMDGMSSPLTAFGIPLPFNLIMWETLSRSDQRILSLSSETSA